MHNVKMKVLQEQLKFKLTRYAPTPSGFLHLGNIFSFIFTYHIAKRFDAKIQLRIDDLDSERVKNKYLQDIFDTLDFLGLPYHLGPKNIKEFKEEYSQQNRRSLYDKAVETLKDSGQLFACDCSRKKIRNLHPKGYYTGYCHQRNLEFESPDVAWRMRLDGSSKIILNDLLKGRVESKVPQEIAFCIIRRKDGLPAYQLASLVDDLHYGTDLIVRGRDLWASSLVQVSIASQLPSNNFSKSLFLHHPLFKGPDNKKLSKSFGATSIRNLRKSGNKKEAIFRLIGAYLKLEKPLNCLEDFEFLSQLTNQSPQRKK
ncbi:glutamate--tRNA ligase family protein [Cecembia lonarensis]|nr:glutamate--tRNA ligase family protein [Cecembia lonarensis]